MSNTDFDYDGDAFTPSFLEDAQRRQAAQSIVQSVDDDPDKAARSVDLARATGANPSLVYGDLDHFEQQQKVQVNTQLVHDNEFLQQYLNSHSMAAAVSHDDLGQLDAASDALVKIPNKSMLVRAADAFMASSGEFGAKEIFSDPYYRRPQDIDFAIQHPEMAAVMTSLTGLAAAPITVGSKLFSGALGVINEFGGRDLASMFEYGLMRGDINQFTGQLPKMAEAITAAKNYLRNGDEPPAGLHPLIDKAKIDQTKEDIGALDDALKESIKSATRDRAPDFYANFARNHVGDREIGISADAVRDLYGDKLPEADDNILGWVPGIADKLSAAEATGGDVKIPLADWLAKVDPEVAKELHDHIRVRDGGLTLDEGKVLEPKETIPEPLPGVRGGAGLEPLFSIGDRKLTLEKKPGKEPSLDDPSIEADHFNIMDENGLRRGFLRVVPFEGGKRLYVDNIGGMKGANMFGPALTRDIARQLKQEYPDAEQIGGFRISGAREAAGSEREVWMKFDDALAPRSRTHVEMLQRILQNQSIDVGKSVLHYNPDLDIDAAKADSLVREELAKIAPSVGKVFTPDAITAKGKPDIQRLGFLHPFREQNPWIVVALESPDAVGVARHEAIHFLKGFGFFSDGEWSTLTRAARDQGWMDKFGINERYPSLDNARKLEEAVAEGFRSWASGEKVPEVTHPIFEKLKELFENLKARLKELLGHEPTWEELFEKTKSGEVGQREAKGHEEGAFFEPSAMDIPKDEKPFERGAIMPKANQDRYDKLIQKRNEEDLDAAMKRAEAEQRQQQTKEWKDNRAALRTEVADDLRSRPDIATDALLAKGDIKLNPEGMTNEQKAALPREYMRKSNSISPDDLAPYFGFTSGDALVERLGLITHERVQAGMSQKDFFNRLVDAETDRQMETRHGNLDANILEEAKDQAISETQLGILHEEVLALGLKAGSEFPISKAELKAWNKQIFDKTPIGGISLDDYLRAAGKAGRAAETALLKEDYIEAFREKQRQNNAMIMAGYAKAYEKQRKSLDRTAKVFRKKDVPSVEPEYLNHIQDTLSKVGYPNARSLANIQENIQRQTETTLQSFIQAKLIESWGLRDMPLADFLEDPKWTKRIDELTADEFARYKATVDSLVKNGRAEQKVIYQGESADRKAVVKQMVDQLKTFPEQDIKSGSEPGFVRESIAGSTAVPTVMNRWDRGDPRGVFHKYVVYPLTQAANGENRLSREITGPFRALGPVGDLKKLVDSPLDPALWRYSSFTRENVLGMLQNAGNKSNWNVTARGWGADPEALMQWLHRNTTKEDWDRAQKMGDTVFKKLVGLADQVYEHENGRTIDKIPLDPIDTPFGTYPGWYHPLIPDGTWLAEKNKVRGGAYQDGDYGHIATSNGYTRTRNGSIYPVELSLDKIPLRISQMIHDISFRTPILEVQKILKDPSLLNAITAHYGKEYSKDFLLSYLKDMAGNDSIPSEFWRKAGNASEYLRQNVIGTYIGFNPYTVMKHAPTAFFMSARDVGPADLGKAYLKIYGKSTDVGGSWKDFINQNSEEIQRRERNWQETLAGQQKVLYGEPTARERVLQWGSWAVAQSDLFSAQALWLARYDKSLAEGSPHGEAVDIANRSVTRQHGSTASTNQPALVRGGGPFHGWLTSVYGFFGTVMQRRIEMVQNMNDIYQLGRQGEINQVANKLPGLFNDIITYVILPTAIEEGVTGLNTDDRRGWGSHLLSATTMGLTNSILYLRDVAYGLASGHDPGVGMASSALHDLEKTIRDLRQGRSMLSKQHAGKTVQDFLTTFGEATGTVPKTLANASRFGIDYMNRQARPKNAAEVLRGLTRGTTERRIER